MICGRLSLNVHRDTFLSNLCACICQLHVFNLGTLQVSDAFHVLELRSFHTMYLCVCVRRRVRIPINSIDLFTLVSNEQGQLPGLPLETLKTRLLVILWSTLLMIGQVALGQWVQ